MSKKTGRPRRKMTTVPGSDFTVTDHEVSLILFNTYQIERANHNANKRMAGRGYEPKAQVQVGDWSRVSSGVEAFESEDQSKFWLKLARVIVSKRFDPRMFIRRQFMLLEPSASSPPKNHLIGTTAFKNYDACKELSRQQIATAFTGQKSTARTEIVLEQDDHEPVEACVEVLWNFDLSLSSLFRYCLALQLAKEYKDDRFKEIADKFLVPAALQFIEDPEAYEIIWGRDWLPIGFRSEAALIYSRVYGV